MPSAWGQAFGEISDSLGALEAVRAQRRQQRLTELLDAADQRDKQRRMRQIERDADFEYDRKRAAFLHEPSAAELAEQQAQRELVVLKSQADAAKYQREIDGTVDRPPTSEWDFARRYPQEYARTKALMKTQSGDDDKPVVPQIIKGMNTLRGADVASNRVGGGLPYNYQPPADSALASQAMLGLGYSPGNRQWDSLKSVSLGNPYPPPSNAGFQGMGSLRMADRMQQPASNVSIGSDPDTQFRSMYDDWDTLSEQEKQAVRQYHAGGGR